MLRRKFGASRRFGFTLIELLVVIAIIAVLMSLLFPVIRRVHDMAKMVQCQTNMRQLVQASIVYASESDGILPQPNWGGQDGPNKPGWLYLNLPTNDPNLVRTGVLWKYINDLRCYHCPLDTGPYPLFNGRPVNTQNLTSYLMNGAVDNYGANAWPYRLARMKPSGILLWEASDSGDSAWNDGASFPYEGETTRHGRGGACIGCFDGHAEMIGHDEYLNIQNQNPGPLNCVPQ
jgi:prepilin-type N-terminal cleavage/methylation domain-containing protein